MVDSINTKTGVLASMPVGVQEGTSVQDIRNAVLSGMGQMGQISNQGNVLATPIALTDTWYSVLLQGATLSEVTQTITSVDDFDMPAAGQLRYLGTTTRHFHCVATVSFTSVSSNQEYHFRFGKNDIHTPQAEVRRKVGAGTDVGALAVHWITTLSQNDYLCLMIKNITSDADITVVSANIQAVGMLM